MSYYQNATEEIKIRNITEDTEALVISIKRYIKDFLKGIRIESFISFKMELTTDEILIVGSYDERKDNNGRIILESLQVDSEGIQKLLDNLEFHKDIHLILEYNCMFFYFYPYGISRIAEFLDEKLKGYVTYNCVEQQENNLRAYRFQELDGRFINGLMKDQDFRNYRHIKEWKVEDFIFYLELKNEIPWELYYRVLKEAETVCKKHGMKLLFESYPPGATDTPLADPGAMEIEPPYNNRTSGYVRDTLKIQEIECIYDDLYGIYNLLKEEVREVNDRWKLVPVDESHGRLTMRLILDSERNLVLSVFDPNAKIFEVMPYEKIGSSVEKIEKLIAEQGEFGVLFDEDILE